MPKQGAESGTVEGRTWKVRSTVRSAPDTRPGPELPHLPQSGLSRKTETAWRRLTGLGLMILIPVLSGVIPILDMWPEDCRVGVEDHHHPGTHGFPHDHRICIQQQANQWAPGGDLPATPAVTTLQAAVLLLLQTRPALKQWVRSPLPRSPPLV